MKRTLVNVLFALLATLSFSLMTATPAHAAARTASVSGNWSDTATWGGSAVPTSADDVTINSGIAVTVDVAAEASTVTFVLATASNSITISGTNSLTVTGLITMPRPATSQTTTIAVGAGSLSAGSLTMSATTSGRNDIISISTGTVTISGTITTGTTGCQFTFTDAGTMNVSGNFSSTPTLTTATGSTVNYAGTAAQNTLGGTYYNLATSGSGTKTVAGSADPTINGNLVVGSGTNLDIQGAVVVVSGNVSVSGTLTHSSTTGSKTYSGDVTINSGGTWTESVNEAFSFGGNLQNDGTFTAGTAAHTFTGSGKTFSGTNTISIPSVSISGTYTNNGALTVSATLAGAGTLTNGATGILNIGGTSATFTLTATATGNTVNYSGAAQTGKVTTYHNLTLSGSGAKTFATTPTVNGVLSMEGTATVTVTTGVVTYGSAATLQYNTTTARTASSEEWITTFAATGGVIIASTGAITLDASKAFNASVPLTINSGATLLASSFELSFLGSGTPFTATGTFTAGTGTVSYTGASQTIAPVTYNNLTINQSSGNASLGGSATVNGILTLTSGGISTGSNTLILSSTGSLTGATSARYVVGNLQKYAATGATSLTFEVGTNANYNPVNIVFGNVTVAGTLTAKPTSGQHANISSSSINSSKDVTSYWTLTNSGISFDSFSANFTFAASDIGGSASASQFFIGKYNSGWTYPTMGARTSTSTQATGLTSFSDFVVGEFTITWVSYNSAAHTVADDNFTAGETTVYMLGQGFIFSHSYAVAYYDGTVSGGGQKVATDSGLTSGTSGNLTSTVQLDTPPYTAVAGTWHSVVFDSDLGTPSANYTAALASPALVANHAFEVTAEAIPEFPTVIAAIMVAGSCFGLYYWMRRKSNVRMQSAI